MIALLNGNIASVTLNGDVTIDVNGVGYKVSMPERETINLRAGNAITVFVHTQVREDSIVLFGFIESSSKELFEKLSTSDVDMLCSVPGIGKKTAQRMVVELSSVQSIFDIFVPNIQSTTQNEVREALEELGYRRDEITSIITNVDPTLSIDVMIKECLRLMAKV